MFLKKFIQSVSLFVLLLPGVQALAQKNFDLRIKLPAGVDKESIQLYLDDGKHEAPLKLQ